MEFFPRPSGTDPTLPMPTDTDSPQPAGNTGVSRYAVMALVIALHKGSIRYVHERRSMSRNRDASFPYDPKMHEAHFVPELVALLQERILRCCGWGMSQFFRGEGKVETKCKCAGVRSWKHGVEAWEKSIIHQERI